MSNYFEETAKYFIKDELVLYESGNGDSGYARFVIAHDSAFIVRSDDGGIREVEVIKKITHPCVRISEPVLAFFYELYEWRVGIVTKILNTYDAPWLIANKHLPEGEYVEVLIGASGPGDKAGYRSVAEAHLPISYAIIKEEKL